MSIKEKKMLQDQSYQELAIDTDMQAYLCH